MTNLRIFSLRGLRIGLALIALGFCASPEALAQSNDQLTPLQRRIEQQKQRLSSGEAEERRDALMKLGGMKRPEASRAAVGSINDTDLAVRVTAFHAITSLPGNEAATLLMPFLKTSSSSCGARLSILSVRRAADRQSSRWSNYWRLRKKLPFEQQLSPLWATLETSP